MSDQAAPTSGSIRIGTAAWNVPAAVAMAFPAEGSHLERYGQVFDAVEINSSFYRSHRVSTYARWAAAVPDGFRFAVKVPQTITHEGKLRGAAPLLDRFLDEIAGLGPKLGPLLVQLPPSLAFAADIAGDFLTALRERFDGPIACEPRHASWFAPDVEALLSDHRIGRVAADPARAPGASEPGGWKRLSYYRLHGSPRIYTSAYSDESIRAITEQLAHRSAKGSECWCIFDNTAVSAAAPNALAAKEIVADLGTKDP